MGSRLRDQTYVLAEDYVLHRIGIQRLPPSKKAEMMRRLAEDMEKQYQSRFNSILQSFITQCRSDPCSTLLQVIEELVGDGKLNWGRIVSLFTFTGLLANELYSQGLSLDCCKSLAKTVADYLGGEKQEWLAQNEGWDGFCKFFQTPKEESSMKTALFAAAGVGIAGIAILLVR